MRAVWCSGLLVSIVTRAPRRAACDRRLHARIRAGVVQQPRVVDLEKPRQRVAGLAEPDAASARSTSTRAPVAHHAAHRLFGQRRAAELGDQLVGRIREVAPGVDERAVEIEGDQAL